jgi:hypothetical protein
MTTTLPNSEERHEELMQEVGGLLLDVAGEDFRRVDVLVKMTVAVHDLTMTVYLTDGSTAEVAPPERLLTAFAELREVVHRPGRGTWFSARAVLNAPARIDITYNLDHDPQWRPEIPAVHFVRDLEVFPRDEVFVPDWLRSKLTGTSAEEQRA